MKGKSIKVKPKKGLKVFNPSTKLHLRDEGDLIVMSTYWQRRLNDKEIEIMKEVVEPKKKSIKKIKNSMEAK